MKVLMSLILIFGLQASSANEIIDVYLTSKNHCSLTGEVTEKSVDAVISCLSRRHRKLPSGEFYLVINSGGGLIKAGNRLIYYLKKNPGIPTVIKFAASMALAIVEGNPGPRYLIKGSRIMQHRMSTSIPFQFFDYKEFLRQVEESKVISDNFHKVNLDRINIDPAYYYLKVNKEWWMYENEALRFNWVDATITADCSKKLKHSKQSYIILTFFGPIKTTINSCPIDGER